MDDKNSNAISEKKKNKRTTVLLLLISLGMFGFGFALVPLYSLYCKTLGLPSANNPLNQEAALQPTASQKVSDRTITIKFDGMVARGLPWEFKALERKMTVRLGEISDAKYYAKNMASEAITGQAVYNVVPWQATPYFSKTECFCFKQQNLKAGEGIEMPLRFVVSPDLPEEINSLTLSYTFLNYSPDSAKKYKDYSPSKAVSSF